MSDTGHAAGRLLSAVFALLILSLCPPLAADDPVTARDFAQLDRDVQTALSELMSSQKGDAPRKQRYFDLLRAISIHDRPLPSLKIIHGVKALLLADPGYGEAGKLIAELFRLNQTWLIAQLRDEADKMGESGLTAIIDLYQAAHDVRQNQWDRVTALVSDNLDEFGETDGQYAQLLLGIAQHQAKQYRKAIEHYRKIPETSDYYLPARINLATAYIRQGWIAEVRELIDGFHKANTQRMLHPDSQRLLIILGYALLTREYYLDASNSFNAIAPDSIYRNRALLGDALALINQEKFRTALQPIQQLLASGDSDLPAQEAYLLLPSVYQKLNDPEKTARAFADAIDHYLLQINHLKAIAANLPTAEQIEIDSKSQVVIIDDLAISYRESVPQSFMLNLVLLRGLSNAGVGKKHRARLRELLTAHRQALQRVLPQLIQQQLKPVRSYLSQSRYGLARFYDQ